MKRKKITIVGSGYVGMSLSVLLAQHNDVTVLDIVVERVEKINKRQSTVADVDIERFLDDHSLSLRATTCKLEAYKDADFIVVATPTNYDTATNRFDTSSVDSVVEDSVRSNDKALVVIKSTVPVGHTKMLQEKHESTRIIFSPEFLREGSALRDNLFPSRIILGSQCSLSREFGSLLQQAAESENIDTLFISSTEAEAVKLFANTYLAMRVSFFNELDSFALANTLDSRSIIAGVCLDERIGNGYNNPSFGYGGYCLPKDTKQLLANYDQIPQTLIQAVVSSNKTRKDFIADEIIKKNPAVAGFYRIVMKNGSDNFRSSAVQWVMRRIEDKGIKVVVYEPSLEDSHFLGFPVIKRLDEFKSISNIIVANRYCAKLSDVEIKLFTRDIFHEN
ncbi:nucleotide sugar dehydrogenase [Luminiphilus sp.]|nr:nucleotide sugar dehydrogenase [Luminiphilus sp.]MDB2313478.1 nucleotide sugar dehydrogenase [Luminiphilus sp.]